MLWSMIENLIARAQSVDEAAALRVVDIGIQRGSVLSRMAVETKKIAVVGEQIFDGMKLAQAGHVVARLGEAASFLAQQRAEATNPNVNGAIRYGLTLALAQAALLDTAETDAPPYRLFKVAEFVYMVEGMYRQNQALTPKMEVFDQLVGPNDNAIIMKMCEAQIEFYTKFLPHAMSYRSGSFDGAIEQLAAAPHARMSLPGHQQMPAAAGNSVQVATSGIGGTYTSSHDYSIATFPNGSAAFSSGAGLVIMGSR